MLNINEFKAFLTYTFPHLIEEHNASQLKHDYGYKGYGGFSYVIMGKELSQYGYEVYQHCEDIVKQMTGVFQKVEREHKSGEHDNSAQFEDLIVSHLKYMRMAQPYDIKEGGMMAKYSNSFTIESKYEKVIKPRDSGAFRLKQLQEEREAHKKAKEADDEKFSQTIKNILEKVERDEKARERKEEELHRLRQE